MLQRLSKFCLKWQKFAKYGHTAHDLEAQKMKPQILKVAKSFRQIFDEIVRQRQKFQSLKVDNFNGQAHETVLKLAKNYFDGSFFYSL